MKKKKLLLLNQSLCKTSDKQPASIGDDKKICYFMSAITCNAMFQSAFQDIRKESLVNDLRNLHIDTKLDYVEKIYKAALEHPRTPVKQLLKLINITECQYKTMRQTHMSISQYRKQALGASRFYTAEQKKVISERMKGKSKKKTVSKTKIMKKVGAGEQLYSKIMTEPGSTNATDSPAEDEEPDYVPNSDNFKKFLNIK